jgi:hypothetical protein
MNRVSRLSATALALVMSASLLNATATASAAGGDAYVNEYATVDGGSQIMAVISDKAGNDFTGVGRVIPPEQQGPTREGIHWCMSAFDKECDFAKDGEEFTGSVVLDDCAETTSDFCVENLSLAVGDAAFENAKFVRSTNQFRFEPRKDINFPGGGSTILYTSANAPTAGGLNTYAVTVSIRLWWNRATKSYEPQTLMANVYPYRTQSDSRIRGIAGSGDSIGAGCIYVEPGSCGILQDWVPNTKAKLSVKVPASIGGWLKGRIKSPEVLVERASALANRIVVAAEPVSVPQLGVVMPVAEKDALLSSGLNLGWWGGPGFNQVGTESGGNTVAEFIERYRSVTKDSASGVTTMWNFATINSGYGSNCLSDKSKVQGIVTTNAMGYDGSAPNYVNGNLSYKVSGMHYMADGKTEVEGTYDLVMRSDTARCLYGFSKAPISATVSVTSASGEAKVATTVVREKDGWLKMAAYGFTFSSPTISVKLTQAGSAPAKKTTITCVSTKNKKLTKKVTAVGPKCPAGYKKK